jgi:glycogenin glucosyltransferase
MKKNAYVTFIIRNDSYMPGALVFAYALKLQKTVNDLICIVSENISENAIKVLRVIYDDVLIIDELYVAHDRRHERQDRPFLFSRFNSFRLGEDGDLGKRYDKIMLADCDHLPLRGFDDLFNLAAPAGIINERKEHCLEYVDGKYIIPDSVDIDGTWNWHEIYRDVPHGTLVPKEMTDRVLTDPTNLGINTSICLFKPTMELYNSIMDDLVQKEVQDRISTYNWPEMQYITGKCSGDWTNIDLKYSSFNGYPKIDVLYGIHFAGLKPWSINNKSVRSFGKFEDYQLWNYTFLKMMKKNPRLSESGKLRRINDFLAELVQNDKYVFKKTHLKQFAHFFK